MRNLPTMGLAVAALVFIIASGCGDNGSDNSSDNSSGGGDGTGTGTADANPGSGDGGTSGAAQCSDGIDNDGDGDIDGFDAECTGPMDDDEGSFATGIPGDNIDAVKQDCFFDGNSGAGDDGCDIHVCCLLDGECPADLRPGQYDPNDCAQTQECIDFCAPLTPPGCDCFGCCTICNDAGCFDILTNPAVAPNCSAETANDPSVCPACTKSADCGPGDDCNNLECQLCPGQDPSDLPASCGGVNVCPNGSDTCLDGACANGQFCSNGCCINVVQ